MKCYVIIEESDITQEMVNRSLGNDWTKLRKNVNKGILDPAKRVFTLSGNIDVVFINYVLFSESEIIFTQSRKVLLQFLHRYL